MKTLIYLLVLVLINCVFSKNNVKSLTESMGQEIIEIGLPNKGLPSDLDEEPSAELDEDKVTTTTLAAATKKDAKKASTPETRRVNKEQNKIDDEEEKIEKELAEIYKDNLDYKAETETTREAITATNEEDKPIARSRNNFKFQPDMNNKAEVERFRTSVDDISCDQRVNKLTGKEPQGNSATRFFSSIIISAVLPTTIYYM